MQLNLRLILWRWRVSSQALKYDRVLGVTFCRNILNIGYDMCLLLSILHGKIAASKLRIFEQCTNTLVNLDSEHCDEISGSQSCQHVSEREDEGWFLWDFNVHKTGNDIIFSVRGSDFDEEFKLSMLGLFNVECAMCDCDNTFVYYFCWYSNRPPIMQGSWTYGGTLLMTKDYSIVDYA